MPNLIKIPTIVNSLPMKEGFARIAYDITESLEADNTDISIYDVISSKKSKDWNGNLGTEVTPSDFKAQLEGCKTKNITIRMNSGGGDVNSANVISVAIQEARAQGKHIVCKIDGLCASAAVQIAISAEEVIMHKSALMMIHNPMAFLFGYYNVNELQSVDNMLTATKNAIMNHYIDKTGLTKQKLSNMMDAETWMDGKEAVEKGFADRLMFEDGEEEDTETENVINRVCTCINSMSFLNIPEEYKPQNTIQKGDTEPMEIKTVEELKATYPDLVNQIINDSANTNAASATEAVEKERERIKAIDELSGKVSAELLNKAKYETFASAETVAMEAIKTGAFVQSNVLNALADESKDTDGVKGLDNNGEPNPEEDKVNITNHAEQVAKNHLKQMGKGE